MQASGGGRLVYWSTVGVPGPIGPTGPTGTTGATGPTGPAGPGAVRAWAYIEADGTLARGSGVASVQSFGNGVYCIFLDGIDASTVAILVTPEGGSGGNIKTAQVIVGCLIGGIQVSIYQDNLAGTNAAFNFLVS